MAKRKRVRRAKRKKRSGSFQPGDSVIVKQGVKDPDFGTDIGGWQGRIVEDKNAENPLDVAISEALEKATLGVLDNLTSREEKVLRMRFGIGMNTDHTLEEVGKQFGVTRERIRQIEAKALRKLRHPSRAAKLKTFADTPEVPPLL